jgi:hypothetical protein
LTKLFRLTGAVGLVAALICLALSTRVAVVRVCCLVTQVGVDAHELAAVLGRDALHVNRPGTVLGAVAARAVHLAVVLGIKVDNVDVAAAVVLDNLVGGVECAASDDVGRAGTLDGDAVLANVLEPDELEIAGSETVDSFALVGTDYDISKGRSILPQSASWSAPQ